MIVAHEKYLSNTSILTTSCELGKRCNQHLDASRTKKDDISNYLNRIIRNVVFAFVGEPWVDWKMKQRYPFPRDTPPSSPTMQ